MTPVRPVFSTRERTISIPLCLLLLALVAYVDKITGPTLDLESLYLIPIMVAAWFGGRWAGDGFGIASAIGWNYAGEPSYGGHYTPSVIVANLAVRLVFYGIVVEMLVALKVISRRLEQRVEERTRQLRAQVLERERAEESLRKLAAQLSEAEDAERKRIAYDIHDALSQMLGLVKLNLEAAVTESVPVPRLHERLQDMVRMTDDLIRQTREMTFDLHPASLDDLGLVPALRGFADEFHRRTGASATISEVGDRQPLQSSLASWLFRAIKELFNNAIRHGKANEVLATVYWSAARLRIVIDDDGSGFDPATAMLPQFRRGLGLAGIDERLTSLGGKLHIESQPDQGTRAILEIPLASQ